MTKVADLKRQTNIPTERLPLLLTDTPCMIVSWGCCGGTPAGYPPGLIINELGVVLLTTKDADEKTLAEETLLKALEMTTRDTVCPAYAFLSSAGRLQKLSRHAEETLDRFEQISPLADDAIRFVGERGLITE